MTTACSQPSTYTKIIDNKNAKTNLVRTQKNKTLSTILKNTKSFPKSLSNVCYLKMIKSKLELLPSRNEYKINFEIDYLRSIS